MKQRSIAGFTLLELLVVLVIVSMASGILLQALAQVMKLQQRFGVQLVQAQQGSKSADWFRQLVQGLQVDLPGGAAVFNGTSVGFAGLSTTALSVDYGAPGQFKLSLVAEDWGRRTRVVYESAGSSFSLWSWVGGGQGRLIYVDAQGHDHEQWPPASGLWPQLPSLIRIEWDQDGRHSVVGVPRGSTEARKAPQGALFLP